MFLRPDDILGGTPCWARWPGLESIQLCHWDTIEEATRLQDLFAVGGGADAGAAAAVLAGVRTLRVSGCAGDALRHTVMHACAGLSGVTALDLFAGGIDVNLARTIVEGAPRIRKLDLACCSFCAGAIRVLAELHGLEAVRLRAVRELIDIDIADAAPLAHCLELLQCQTVEEDHDMEEPGPYFALPRAHTLGVVPGMFGHGILRTLAAGLPQLRHIELHIPLWFSATLGGLPPVMPLVTHAAFRGSNRLPPDIVCMQPFVSEHISRLVPAATELEFHKCPLPNISGMPALRALTITEPADGPAEDVRPRSALEIFPVVGRVSICMGAGLLQGYFRTPPEPCQTGCNHSGHGD